LERCDDTPASIRLGQLVEADVQRARDATRESDAVLLSARVGRTPTSSKRSFAAGGKCALRWVIASDGFDDASTLVPFAGWRVSRSRVGGLRM
jgi:hypothetical protein